MTDFEFEQYITSVIKEYGADYIDESLIDNTPHKFSPEFERKMAVLMGKSHKKMRITPKRLLVAVTAALLAVFIMAMSVSAIREAFVNFITNIFSTHTEVQSVNDTGAPLDFTDKYEITADMSDYELIDLTEDISEREYTYENENCTIYFTQNIKQYYNILVNTEGYETEKISINGCEGFYVNMYDQNGQILIWDNGDYVLSILVLSCDEYKLDKNVLINMANSVQKVEKWENFVEKCNFTPFQMVISLERGWSLMKKFMAAILLAILAFFSTGISVYANE